MKTQCTFRFITGAISGTEAMKEALASSVSADAGAGSIFYGQVREDLIAGKKVQGIEYTHNAEMCERVMQEIFNDNASRFNCLYALVLHSQGPVAKGEICLYVHCVCKHRAESFDSCRYLVERIKKELPVWGKEYFEDQTHVWKINT